MAKKDPREVELQRELKETEKSCKLLVTKTFKKNEVAARVVNELHDLAEKEIKLRHFLWEKKTTQDGEVVSHYTDAAKALPGKHRQLLIRQRKVMVTYIEILKQRVELFAEAK